jgi:ABC-2 type transport system permease protein
VGLVFGALALAFSAGTGRTGVAAYGTAGAALVFHLLTSFVNITGAVSALEWVSPFHYYLGSDPLMNGMAWGSAGILAVLALVLIALSFVLFQRRDIRQRG